MITLCKDTWGKCSSFSFGLNIQFKKNPVKHKELVCVVLYRFLKMHYLYDVLVHFCCTCL